jgi:hypothetical protein
MTRAYGRATGDEARQNAEVRDAFNIWRHIFSRLGKYLIEGAMYINHAFIKAAQALLSAAAAVSRQTGAIVRYIGSILPTGMGRNRLMDAGSKISDAGDRSRDLNAELDKILDRMWRGGEAMQKAWGGIFAAGGAIDGALDNVFGGAGNMAGDATNPNADIIHQWAQSVRQIERDAANQRLEATRSYEQQRTETIASYELGIARDAEDFARARARAADALNRQIADIQADAAKREADAEQDYRERVTDLRDDTNERLAKLDADYQKKREQAALDHRDRLLDAAGRLDAVAVREEQRRYAREQQEAADNYNEQRSEQQQALDERLQEERKSYDERLEEQRAADAERIADLQSSLAEQQRLEDEDRAIAAQRRAEDFQRQLQQQDAAHAERLAQISSQAAQERAQLDEAFMAQLADAGVYNENWMTLQQAKQAESLALFDAWWGAINQRFGERPIGPLPAESSGWLTDFAGGRSAWPTGEVAPVAPASGGGGTRGFGSRTVNVQSGAIQIYATPAQSEADVARMVRDEMIALLEGVQ